MFQSLPDVSQKITSVALTATHQSLLGVEGNIIKPNLYIELSKRNNCKIILGVVKEAVVKTEVLVPITDTILHFIIIQLYSRYYLKVYTYSKSCLTHKRPQYQVILNFLCRFGD